MSEPARWAVLGAGAITTDFVRGLATSSEGVLYAVGARDTGRAEAYAREHDAVVAGSYEEVVGREDVDAVYIGTVHTTHAELAAAALEAGKAVLCEKPLTTSPGDTAALIAVAERTGLPLVEAFKYRFGPLPDLLRTLVGEGALGQITEIETSFGFRAPTPAGRLFDPALAGGAILDAGCYPVSLAVGVADWAGERAAPRILVAEGVVGEVDEQASVTIELGAITARLRTAITAELPRAARISGADGTLEIPNVWGSRTQSTAAAVLWRADGSVERLMTGTVNPMAAEADATIRALRAGRTQAPEMPWRDTLTIADLLAGWRAAL